MIWGVFCYRFSNQAVNMKEFRPVSVLGRGHFGKVSFTLYTMLVELRATSSPKSLISMIRRQL